MHKVIEKNKDIFSHILDFKLEYDEHRTPYQILYRALRHKTRQIIAQEEVLSQYRNKLQNILCIEAQTLIDVIPEIEIILGKQSLPSRENRKKLDSLLVHFMELFLDIEKPLCIYIDDVQWADKVTIDWITNIILKLENIVFFLTYRDDDIDISKHHRLTEMLNELSSANINIDEVEIVPLTRQNIESLIVDNMQLTESKEVAKLIFERTKGNSFFVKQYLKQLHKDGAIYFDMKSLNWKCDVGKIDTLQISDNVFDMLCKNINVLDEDVRQLLCIASCIGNTFSYDLLKKYLIIHKYLKNHFLQLCL